MSLEERLHLLQERSAPGASPAGDLGERVRRLRGEVPRQQVRRVCDGDEKTLEAVLGAERLAPGVLRVEQRVPLDECHGRVRLGKCRRALPDLCDGPAGDPGGWLFLDTETSGLAGGTGTWAFLCGVAQIEGEALALRQYLLTRLDAEPAYLAAFLGELEAAKLLVTYNGKSFDLPLLSTRLRLGGLAHSLDLKPHLDLLAPVRRAFGRVWPDCRLATAESSLLGIERTDDLPGAAAPQAWLAWLRQGEAQQLAAVLDHNHRDLLSLPALVPPLLWSYCDPIAAGADVRAIARQHLAHGFPGRAYEVLFSNRKSLPAPALLDLARLHRRRGEWSAARRIWEGLSAQGDAQAIEAMAKLLEHRERDPGAALAMAQCLPPGPVQEHRCRRLETKMMRQRRQRNSRRSAGRTG